MEPLAQFPTSILTERLSLRRYTPDNAAELMSMIERNRTMLQTSFAPMAQQLTRLSNVIEYISTATLLWNQATVFQYGIHRRFDDHLIGQLKIKNVSLEKAALELSYFIDHAWQRQGFARESVQAIVRTAFDKHHFRKINIRVIATNLASLQMAAQAGFVEEKIRKRDFVCGFGKVHDVHYLVLHNTNLR